MAAVLLITGSSGLLGQHFLRQWNAENFTIAHVNRRSHDLLIPGVGRELVTRLRPAVVLHLAWEASGTPGYRNAPVNSQWLRASLELAAASHDAGAWFVGTGTSVDTEGAGDAYTLAKGDLWRALESEVLSGRMTWLRPYYVIDPIRRRPMLVEQALAARAAGQLVALRTPDSRHDFIHASDAGNAIQVAIRHGVRGVLDLGAGRLRCVSDLVEALGVPWRVALDVLDTPTQNHGAADIRWLHDRGWSPSLTEEFFGRD